MAIIKLQGEQELADGIYYEVETDSEPLGSGGMGLVMPGWRVDKNEHRQPAAIKFLYEDLPDFVIERAKVEASIQLRNDNLVEMFGFIQVKGIGDNGAMCVRNHVASELLTGVMLFDLLNGKTTTHSGEEFEFAKQLYSLSQDNKEKFASTIVKSILSGLMALHDKGYVHRDIDPSNIMITTDGKIKIIDFGVVKDMHKSQRQNLSVFGQIIGKPAYAAPEVAYGLVEDHDAATDIYAVGILLYQLVTGHLPFTGDQAQVLEAQKNLPLPLDEIKNKKLRSIIEKATSKAKSDRYQTAAEFRVAVEHLQAPNGQPKTDRRVRHNTSPTKGNTIAVETAKNSIDLWIWIAVVVLGLLVGFLVGVL